jgi:diguanylate cyclase (GGDEF)-like protein
VPPLVALLALLVRERESRLAQAQARLDALQRERGRLRVAVRRIGEAFGTRLDLDALLGVTLGAAAEALDADAAHASRGGEECARRGDAARFAEVLAAAEAAARAGDAVTAVAVGADHALAAPVGAEGVIAVARGEAPFAPDERELFAYLAAQAALSARDIARHDELSRQALTDGLTGLANHRRFHERLHDDAARAARRGAPLSLVLVDLDDFKAVNDTHGHQAGDAVLREVAARLALAVPAGTEPARYGGEELAVALPGLALPEAEAVAERARAAIRAQPVALPDGGALTVTASLGVAPLGADGDPDALVATADAALYSAKAAGKDRVVVAAYDAAR